MSQRTSSDKENLKSIRNDRTDAVRCSIVRCSEHLASKLNHGLFRAQLNIKDKTFCENR